MIYVREKFIYFYHPLRLIQLVFYTLTEHLFRLPFALFFLFLVPPLLLLHAARAVTTSANVLHACENPDRLCGEKKAAKRERELEKILKLLESLLQQQSVEATLPAARERSSWEKAPRHEDDGVEVNFFQLYFFFNFTTTFFSASARERKEVNWPARESFFFLRLDAALSFKLIGNRKLLANFLFFLFYS